VLIVSIKTLSFLAVFYLSIKTECNCGERECVEIGFSCTDAGISLVTMDNTIVATAIPQIVGDLGGFSLEFID